MKIIRNKGFTLIGLMTTLTVLAVLSYLSIAPAKFQIIKHQSNSVADSLQYIQSESTSYFLEFNEWPQNGDILIFGFEDKYVSEITLFEEGDFEVIYGNQAHKSLVGKYLSLVPNIDRFKQVRWTCYTNIEPPFTPKSCNFEPEENH